MHGSPDQRGHEVCHVERGLFVLDELPDCLFGEFLADAVGDLQLRRLDDVGR